MLYASTTAPESGAQWQIWYVRDQQDIKTLADIEIETFDLEYHRDLELSGTSTLSFGAGYRMIHSDLSGDDPFWLDFEPSTVTQNNFRAFAVDTMSFPEKDLELSFGLQAEYTEFTQLELQPTVRAAWSPSGRSLLWGGVTRAVRTPSLEERTLTDDSFIAGSDEFQSEELLAYELGYRRWLSEDTSFDLALFYNEYDEAALPVFDEDDGVFRLANESSGDAYGAEVSFDYRVNDDWRLRSAYSYLVASFVSDVDGTRLETGEQSPKHTFNVRSYYDLGKDWELDAGVYLSEGLGDFLEEAEYVRSDVRVAWHPMDGLELAIGAQGIERRRRSEFDEFDQIPRSFFFSVTLQR